MVFRNLHSQQGIGSQFSILKLLQQTEKKMFPKANTEHYRSLVINREMNQVQPNPSTSQVNLIKKQRILEMIDTALDIVTNSLEDSPTIYEPSRD